MQHSKVLRLHNDGSNSFPLEVYEHSRDCLPWSLEKHIKSVLFFDAQAQ